VAAAAADLKQIRKHFDMKMRPSTLFLVGVIGIFGFALYQGVAAQAPAAAARTPVVVELFTSEGCSTCPPADRLLMKLEAEQSIKNVEIIALEEHVDYWNQGGWMDPFSSDIFTARQTAYAESLRNGNAYTPQMVVDGQKEFVGSREDQARGTIEQAGAEKKVDVTIEPGNYAAGESPTFRIKIGAIRNPPKGDAPEVWLAITETGLHSEVKRGENAGEDLHHAAVVRKLHKMGLAKDPGDTSFSSDERVKLDRSWKRENTRVVVFVQERKSKKILGAASTTFPK
jgi:hypothetical protein